jgi:hypothetical protein
MKHAFIISFAVLYASATAADLALLQENNLVEPIYTNDAIDQEVKQPVVPEPMNSADPEDSGETVDEAQDETTKVNTEDKTPVIKSLPIPEPAKPSKNDPTPLDLRPVDGIPVDEESSVPTSWFERTLKSVQNVFEDFLAFFEESIFTIFWSRMAMTNNTQAFWYALS